MFMRLGIAGDSIQARRASRAVSVFMESTGDSMSMKFPGFLDPERIRSHAGLLMR
jgi:hypothetical protein